VRKLAVAVVVDVGDDDAVVAVAGRVYRAGAAARAAVSVPDVPLAGKLREVYSGRPSSFHRARNS
jgi:hypothetical protein